MTHGLRQQASGTFVTLVSFLKKLMLQNQISNGVYQFYLVPNVNDNKNNNLIFLHYISAPLKPYYIHFLFTALF